MSATTPSRARRSVFQRFVLVGNIVAMAAFLLAAALLAYGYTKYAKIPRVEIAEFLTDASPSADGVVAENYLLVGVDSADGLDPDDPVRSSRSSIGGIRSDTMMILRVDPASSRAALLSIPRDLYVPIARTSRSAKINSAIQIGGPERLIETIQDYLGIPVNHYVQVDFEGFSSVVDALDGVPLYFPNPVRDLKSGLDISEAGCVNLDARNALGFVRSRAYQEFIDGRWRTDGTGDLGRVRRQQEFIVQALDRAFTRGVRNPVTLNALIDGALDAVTIDDTLDGDDIVDLAGEFRNFHPSELDLYDLPVVGGSAGGASILRLQSQAAEPVLDIFRNIDPSSVSESSVRVRVLNGTGEPGQASTVATDLRSRGFSIGGTGDARVLGSPRSEIRYPPGDVAAADLVARWLVSGGTLVEDPDVADVTLVTGNDFRGVRDEPEESSDATTTTTLPRATSTTSPGSSAPSTTVLGTIPTEDPVGVDCG
ncbi:LCP family protein [Actinospongicola halichondriae]|uniref:LCP family protein n=1 Tax=Actinospongicola halichondriae TaxID=3236844 RepID=UPI003D538227